MSRSAPPSSRPRACSSKTVTSSRKRDPAQRRVVGGGQEAGRADRAGDEAVLADGLARDLRGAAVDLERPLAQAPLVELQAAGLEGVGLHDLGARVDHRRVDALDDVGAVEDEHLVRAAGELVVVLEGEVELLEGRAHAAVEDDDAVADGIEVVAAIPRCPAPPLGHRLRGFWQGGWGPVDPGLWCTPPPPWPGRPAGPRCGIGGARGGWRSAGRCRQRWRGAPARRARGPAMAAGYGPLRPTRRTRASPCWLCPPAPLPRRQPQRRADARRPAHAQRLRRDSGLRLAGRGLILIRNHKTRSLPGRWQCRWRPSTAMTPHPDVRRGQHELVVGPDRRLREWLRRAGRNAHQLRGRAHPMGHVDHVRGGLRRRSRRRAHGYASEVRARVDGSVRPCRSRPPGGSRTRRWPGWTARCT